jgi:hypothetical protein
VRDDVADAADPVTGWRQNYYFAIVYHFAEKPTLFWQGKSSSIAA